MKIIGLKGEANAYILRRFDGVMLVDPSCNYEEIVEKISGLKLWGYYSHMRIRIILV